MQCAGSAIENGGLSRGSRMVLLHEKKQLRRRNDVREPNPRLQVSKSTRLGQSHHATSTWSTLHRAQQLILASSRRPPGGTCHRLPCRWRKSQLLKFLFVEVYQRIYFPVESRIIVSEAITFCPLMPGGCIKSSQCQ